MIYIDACVDATVMLMKADRAKLTRTSYNLGGISFTPGEFLDEVQLLLPDLKVEYEPVEWRTKIAESWPRSFDDTLAQQDWGWRYNPSVRELARTILTKIDAHHKAGKNINL